jgi:hypothetical protein
MSVTMSGWIDLTDAGEPGDCALYEHLHRDDGKCLGVIIRYHHNGPTYAWCQPVGGQTNRIGACSSDQAARAAVERALEGGARPRGRRWVRLTRRHPAG